MDYITHLQFNELHSLSVKEGREYIKMPSETNVQIYQIASQIKPIPLKSFLIRDKKKVVLWLICQKDHVIFIEEWWEKRIDKENNCEYLEFGFNHQTVSNDFQIEIDMEIIQYPFDDC